METKQEAAAESTAATAKKPQSINKKMSPQQEQYYKAIAMSSAELGAAIRVPTGDSGAR